MDTVATMTVALAAIGLGALAFVQLNRRENIADDFSDTDCRTTALAEMLGELRPVRNLEGGVSEQGGRAGTDGSHSHEQAISR